jgi:hypothetical protein
MRRTIPVSVVAGACHQRLPPNAVRIIELEAPCRAPDNRGRGSLAQGVSWYRKTPVEQKAARFFLSEGLLMICSDWFWEGPATE